MLPKTHNHYKQVCFYYKRLFNFACKGIIAPLYLIMVIFWLCNFPCNLLYYNYRMPDKSGVGQEWTYERTFVIITLISLCAVTRMNRYSLACLCLPLHTVSQIMNAELLLLDRWIIRVDFGHGLHINADFILVARFQSTHNSWVLILVAH